MEHGALPEGAQAEIKTSEADLDELSPRLAEWISSVEEREVRVRNLQRPQNSGMSSVSVLCDLEWDEDGTTRSRRLVVRLAPEATALPVFPSYDLQRQFDVMRAVSARTEIPLPRVRWVEPTGDILGVPFMVMDRVEGQVPVDNPPYVFGGWLLDMSREEQAALQQASVEVLAAVHAIEDVEAVVAPLPGPAGQSNLRRHFETERAYYEWTQQHDGLRIPVLDDAFAWIEEHWPAEPSPDVVCWGDSRIGNIIYDGTRPVGVLDWEMAVPAPRELDLGWFLFFHRFFQDIADVFEMPGLGHMFRRADVVAAYEKATGAEVRDLDFYLTYAALRHGIVMSQIERRRVHFGEVEAHGDPNDYVLHAQMLTDLVAGTYDWDK